MVAFGELFAAPSTARVWQPLVTCSMVADTLVGSAWVAGAAVALRITVVVLEPPVLCIRAIIDMMIAAKMPTPARISRASLPVRFTWASNCC